MKARFEKRHKEPKTRSTYHDGSKPGRKDIFAFVIATYQLFLPLVLALIIVGAVVAVILIYIR